MFMIHNPLFQKSALGLSNLHWLVFWRSAVACGKQLQGVRQEAVLGLQLGRRG
jgi:hypothetical protein